MDLENKSTKQKILIYVFLGSLLLSLLVAVLCYIVGFFATFNLAMGRMTCFPRYIEQDSMSFAGNTEKEFSIRADGNYSGKISAIDDNQGFAVDLSSDEYGKWFDPHYYLGKGVQIQLSVQGKVSLCRSFIPPNNLAQDSEFNSDGELIPIPKIEEDVEALPIIFDGKTTGWRNVIEIFNGDEYEAYITKGYPDKLWEGELQNATGSVQVQDVFTNNLVGADCAEGQSEYSPICDRFAPLGKYFNSRVETDFGNSLAETNAGSYLRYDWIKCDCGLLGCFDNAYRQCSYAKPNPDFVEAIKPFSSHGENSTTYPIKDIIDGTFPAIDLNYSNDKDFLYSEVQRFRQAKDKDGHNSQRLRYAGPDSFEEHRDTLFQQAFDQYLSKEHFIPPSSTSEQYSIFSRIINHQHQYFWLTEGVGLLAQEQESSASSDSYGSEYQMIGAPFRTFDDFLDKRSFINPFEKGYLQYRYFSNNNDSTGGYVVRVKHTKCIRNDGIGFADPGYETRGLLKVLFLPTGQDPNIDGYDEGDVIKVTLSENGTFDVPPQNSSGKLWFLIDNKQEDYQHSTGSYKVTIYNDTKKDQSFVLNVLHHITKRLKSLVKDASNKLFQNITCYKFNQNADNCTNFFNYLRAILTLYVMSQALLFLMGSLEINTYEFVIKLIKVGFVAGLMNEKTFEFFNDYLFDTLMYASDHLIKSISGYTAFTGMREISNPFMFMDALLTRIFLGPQFWLQLLTLLGTGFYGVMYFTCTIMSLTFTLIAVSRSIAIYLMAFIAVGILLGLSPIFLSFLLFDQTRYLFDNWVKYLMQFILEPVIIIGGIIILVQMYTVALDQAIGYSLCWDCALTFKIPLLTEIFLPTNLSNIPIFCIQWFVPWGHNPSAGLMGIDMTQFVLLIMISYILYGAVEFLSSLSASLLSSLGVFESNASSAGQGFGDTAESYGKGLGRYAAPAAKSYFGINKALNAIEERRKGKSSANNDTQKDGNDRISDPGSTRSNLSASGQGNNDSSGDNSNIRNNAAMRRGDFSRTSTTGENGNGSDDTAQRSSGPNVFNYEAKEGGESFEISKDGKVKRGTAPPMTQDQNSTRKPDHEIELKSGDSAQITSGKDGVQVTKNDGTESSEGGTKNDDQSPNNNKGRNE